MPAICHARAKDGTRLACHSVGVGPALVMLFPYHINDLVLNWAVPAHRQADIEVIKQRYSAFVGTTLHDTLRERGVSSLIILGLTTNVCVQSTVRDGWQLDLRNDHAFGLL